LGDNTRKEMALILFQPKNEIFGTGTLTEGDSTLIVTAAGTEDSDNNLDLFIISLGNINLYKLRLTTDGNSARRRLHRSFGQRRFMDWECHWNQIRASGLSAVNKLQKREL
jgi:hypothetical protein